MTAELISFREPRSFAGMAVNPPALFLVEEGAARFYGFFTVNHRNKNTRRAYYKAACRFSDWCQGRGVLDLQKRGRSSPAADGVQPHLRATSAQAILNNVEGRFAAWQNLSTD